MRATDLWHSRIVVCTILGLILSACVSQPQDAFWQTLEDAWGPESPEILEKYLAARESCVETYQDFEIQITNWSMGEIGSSGRASLAALSVARFQSEIDKALEAQGLSKSDYYRLTTLVYGRWLRSVRDVPPREIRMVRVLQELLVAASRIQQRAERNGEVRVAESAAQDVDLISKRIERLHPFAITDKAGVLSRIDAGTREWLAEHRDRIEAASFGVFDTVPPGP